MTSSRSYLASAAAAAATVAAACVLTASAAPGGNRYASLLRAGLPHHRHRPERADARRREVH